MINVDRHEIVGSVAEVGSAGTNFKVVEIVGMGCLVHSCHKCDSCEKGWGKVYSSIASRWSGPTMMCTRTAQSLKVATLLSWS